MDKNRPLPPGSILDLYRQRDYDRRKSNRFPKPLMPSNVEMLDFDGVNRFIKGDYVRYVENLYNLENM